ncbi:MAG: pre-peptidase C-terminal domain-containing protein [Victivallaceae bacterium]|nr:pre-peptidase C-terminal domain-containing protein [Victivallaceae bacterium]
MQIVFLNFDGASTSYRNDSLELDFKVEVQSASFSTEEKLAILSALAEKYRDQDVQFTLSKPDSGQKYSTVYIGQNDAFEPYGGFDGIAETIDAGNRTADDNAFVIARPDWSAEQVVEVAGHELDHILLGKEHEGSSGTLADYAYARNTYVESWDTDARNNVALTIAVYGVTTVTGHLDRTGYGSSGTGYGGDYHNVSIDTDCYAYTPVTDELYLNIKTNNLYNASGATLLIYDAAYSFTEGAKNCIFSCAMTSSSTYPIKLTPWKKYYIAISGGLSSGAFDYTLTMGGADTVPTKSGVWRLIWADTFNAVAKDNAYTTKYVFEGQDKIKVLFRLNNSSLYGSTSATKAVVTLGNASKTISIAGMAPQKGKTFSYTFSTLEVGNWENLKLSVRIGDQVAYGEQYVSSRPSGGKGNNTDDWNDLKTRGASGFLGRIGAVSSAQALVSSDWVGYGDAVDYKEFTLTSAANLRFDVVASGASKFTVYQLVSKTSRGVTTYSLKALQSTTPSSRNHYDATTKSLLLTKGTYYLAMKSTNAAIGGSSTYAIGVNSDSTFFTRGDNTDDWTDLKTRGASGKVGNLGAVSSAQTLVSSDWVGYGDAVDYKAFTLNTAANLRFDVAGTDASKFTIYQLVSKTSRGVTTYSLKALQSTTLSARSNYDATTKNLLLTKGTYYLAMTSTNASKGGASEYSIAIDKESVFFPAGDNRNDTWTAASANGAAAMGDTVGGWVGYGDAVDYYAFRVTESGNVSFDLDAATAAAVNARELKIRCLDSRGRSVSLVASGADLLRSGTELTAGVYYLGVSSADVKKYDTSYQIELGMLA